MNLKYVSYSLNFWSTHLFHSFRLTEQIGFVYVRAQTTKLVQANTIACSSSAMLEQAQLDALDITIIIKLMTMISGGLGGLVAWRLP